VNAAVQASTPQRSLHVSSRQVFEPNMAVVAVYRSGKWSSSGRRAEPLRTFHSKSSLCVSKQIPRRSALHSKLDRVLSNRPPIRERGEHERGPCNNAAAPPCPRWTCSVLRQRAVRRRTSRKPRRPLTRRAARHRRASPRSRCSSGRERAHGRLARESGARRLRRPADRPVRMRPPAPPGRAGPGRPSPLLPRQSTSSKSTRATSCRQHEDVRALVERMDLRRTAPDDP
jgi:hypothetical protein